MSNPNRPDLPRRRCFEHPSPQRPLSSTSEGSSDVLFIDYVQIPSAHAPGDLNYNNVLQSTPISPEHPPLEYDQSFVQRSRKRNAIVLEHGLPSASHTPSPMKRRRNAVFIENRNAIFVENGLPSAPRGTSPTQRRRKAVIFENGYIPTHHEYLIERTTQNTQVSQNNNSVSLTSQIAQPSPESGDQEDSLTNQSYGWDLKGYYANEDVGTGTHFGY